MVTVFAAVSAGKPSKAGIFPTQNKFEERNGAVYMSGKLKSSLLLCIRKAHISIFKNGELFSSIDSRNSGKWGPHIVDYTDSSGPGQAYKISILPPDGQASFNNCRAHNVKTVKRP